MPDKISPKKVEKKKKEIIDLCICRQCPTYVEGAEPTGYCFPYVGKNEKIKKEQGCICPTCPVTEKMGFKNAYYCTKGSEKEQLETDSD